MPKPDLRTRLKAEAAVKPRGNVITAAQVSAARPLAFACLALAEAALVNYFDEETGVGEAIRAPSELLGPLP